MLHQMDEIVLAVCRQADSLLQRDEVAPKSHAAVLVTIPACDRMRPAVTGLGGLRVKEHGDP